MSRGWSGGSTRAWRKIRARVLARDQRSCRLRLPGCTATATQVHHTHGVKATGHDERYLVAVCQPCNLRVGDPTRAPDPPPARNTRW